MAAGIRVSQAGVDLRLAADYQLVFSSDWPSLQIAFDRVIQVPANATITTPHGLGLYPLTMAWVIKNGVNLGRLFTISENFESPDQTNVELTFDNENVILTNNSGIAYAINVKCYNLDISKQVDYTLPKPPTTKTTYDPTFGIKVVKYGKSITSSDLRDFILHSRAQSPAVLSVVTQATLPLPVGLGGFTDAIQYTNPPGYVPWVLAFVKRPGSGSPYTCLAPGFQQSGYRFNLSTTSYIVNSTGKAYGSLVALRDPLVIPATKFITYNG
jgi:hypothetical protein